MYAFVWNNTNLYLNVFIRGPFAETQLLLAPGQAARVQVIPGRKGLVGFDVTSNQLVVLRPIHVSSNGQVFLVAGGSPGGPPVVIQPGSPLYRDAEGADADNSGGLLQSFDDIPGSGL